jgi:hypothetical protein
MGYRSRRPSPTGNRLILLPFSVIFYRNQGGLRVIRERALTIFTAGLPPVGMVYRLRFDLGFGLIADLRQKASRAGKSFSLDRLSGFGVLAGC